MEAGIGGVSLPTIPVRGAQRSGIVVSIMCGIAGIIGLDAETRPNPAALDRMVEAMRHRGPDDRGVVIGPRVGLGMRRLSIIDLSSGQQPIYNEDQTVWTVYNGEIYNFADLRQKLRARGHIFRTNSDTERSYRQS